MVMATEELVPSGEVKLIWQPINRAQDDFVASPAGSVLFSAAFGAGKTIALCAKALKLSLDYPHNFGYICRKVRATIGLSTLKTFLDLVCPKELITAYNKQEGLITLTNGSQLLFGGLDDPLKLGSLGAGGVGFVGVDEAIETVEDDWNMLEGRLRLPGVPHQIFAATNPGLHPIIYIASSGLRGKGKSIKPVPTITRYCQRTIRCVWLGLRAFTETAML